MKKLFCITLLAILVTACSLAQLRQHEPLVQLTVQAATARVLAEKPAWKVPVREITETLLTYSDGTAELSIAGLTEYASGQIPWDKITPEE